MISLHFLLATHRGSAVTLPPHSSTGFTTFDLTNLQPFSNYSIMVTAETEQGEGPFSEPIFCLTEQSGKGQRSRVKGQRSKVEGQRSKVNKKLYNENDLLQNQSFV
jgi:hypothetical protein